MARQRPIWRGSVRHAAAELISAVPLEPAARIVRMDPALLSPNGEGLAGVDAEEVEGRVAPVWRQLRAAEPVRRKLVPAVGHVFPTEHPEPQHFAPASAPARSPARSRGPWRDQFVAVAALHLVIDAHRRAFHRDPRAGRMVGAAARAGHFDVPGPSVRKADLSARILATLAARQR